MTILKSILFEHLYCSKTIAVVRDQKEKRLEKPNSFAVDDAAKYLRVNRIRVYRMLGGEIPSAAASKSAGSILDLDELRRFIETNPPAPAQGRLAPWSRLSPPALRE